MSVLAGIAAAVLMLLLLVVMGAALLAVLLLSLIGSILNRHRRLSVRTDGASVASFPGGDGEWILDDFDGSGHATIVIDDDPRTGTTAVADGWTGQQTAPTRQIWTIHPDHTAHWQDEAGECPWCRDDPELAA